MSLNIYLLQIPLPDENLIHQFLQHANKTLKEKVLEQQFSADQWRVILTDLFIRKIISQELMIPYQEIEIVRNEFGKPFLRNGSRQFNISHSKDYIAMATDETSVGIDIEFQHPLNDLEDLIVTSFSHEEQELMQKSEDRLATFYELWTLKECYIKALGKGMSCDIKSFSINTIYDWHFRTYDLGEYKMAVCAQKSNSPKDPIIVSFSTLFDES